MSALHPDVAARLDRLGADWPHRERSASVEANGMVWHVQRFGGDGTDAARPRILLLHGTGASTHSFRDCAPLLAHDADVLVPDLPGHAASGTPRGDGLTLPSMAKGIGVLCRKLEFAPDIVVGHSAGVAVAIGATLEGHLAPKAIIGFNAALKPIEGYALFSPLAKALFLNPLTPSLFAQAGGRETTARRLIEGTGSRIDRWGIELYRRLFAERSHVNGALGMMANWDLATLQRHMPALRVPLVLVTATDDRAIPAHDAPEHLKRVRHGRHIALSSGGHLLHEERPKEAVVLIENAMNEVGLRFAHSD